MAGFDQDETSRATTKRSLPSVQFEYDEQELQSGLASVSRLVTDTSHWRIC